MSRVFTTYADSSSKELLARLAAKPAPSPAEYQQYMVQVGAKLGEIIARGSTQRAGCFIACTNEDADFLAKGLLTELEMSGFRDIAIACFWNDRQKVGDVEFAPIIRKYMEPAAAATPLIVVKAIISTACVVKTNIQELLSSLKPEQIIVAAPVMMKGAQEQLESEFDPQVRSKFSYIYFAEDDTRNENGEVVPGIGGMVYQLLGIGDSATKNSYTPSLVRWRRKTLPSSRSGQPKYDFTPPLAVLPT